MNRKGPEDTPPDPRIVSGRGWPQRNRFATSSSYRWNVTQLGVPTLARPGQIEASVDPSFEGYSICDTGQFMESSALLAHASTVDNRTGGAVFSLAQTSWADYSEQCGETPDDDCDPMNKGMVPFR